MASVVHLIRHGEVRQPSPHRIRRPALLLSQPTRRRQAAWAGNHLVSRPIEAVYSSPLDRAVETAGVIAARRGLEVETVPDLTEWALMGRWSGLPWPDLDSHFPGELEVYLTRPLEMDFTPRVGGAARRPGGGRRLVPGGRASRRRDRGGLPPRRHPGGPAPPHRQQPPQTPRNQARTLRDNHAESGRSMARNLPSGARLLTAGQPPAATPTRIHIRPPRIGKAAPADGGSSTASANPARRRCR